MAKHKLTQGLALLLALAFLCSCSQDLARYWTFGQRTSLQEEESGGEEPIDVFEYRLDSRIPWMVRQQITENRRLVFQPIDNAVKSQVERYLTPSLDPAKDKEIAGILSGGLADSDETEIDIPSSLSHKEATEDIEFLFSYLKYGYCGYQYLGGDMAFDKVKAGMLADLENRPDPIGISEYKNEILIAHLQPVIVDSHFIVDGESFSKIHTQRYYSYSEELLFAKEGDSFTAQVEGRAADLVAVDGKEPGSFVRLILDETGSPAWGIGISHVQPLEDTDVTLTLRDKDGKSFTHQLALTQADTDYLKEFTEEASGYNRYEADGIPVLENRRLYAEDKDPLNETDPQLTALVEEAAVLRDEPVFILDLRGNPGGNDTYAFRWVQNYAGLPSPQGYASINVSLLTSTVFQSAQWIRTWLEEIYARADSDGRIPGWTDILYDRASLIPNENIIFVLMDSGVASSAESFVAALREMENVILVGTSTGGMGTMGNIREIYLPKSRLCITCGFSLSLTPDLSPFEGVGYAPDLWVPPGESLDRVLLFAEKYQLYGNNAAA